jgi:hypothetical protein
MGQFGKMGQRLPGEGVWSVLLIGGTLLSSLLSGPEETYYNSRLTNDCLSPDLTSFVISAILAVEASSEI